MLGLSPHLGLTSEPPWWLKNFGSSLRKGNLSPGTSIVVLSGHRIIEPKGKKTNKLTPPPSDLDQTPHPPVTFSGSIGGESKDDDRSVTLLGVIGN